MSSPNMQQQPAQGRLSNASIVSVKQDVRMAKDMLFNQEEYHITISTANMVSLIIEIEHKATSERWSNTFSVEGL